MLDMLRWVGAVRSSPLGGGTRAVPCDHRAPAEVPIRTPRAIADGELGHGAGALDRRLRGILPQSASSARARDSSASDT